MWDPSQPNSVVFSPGSEPVYSVAFSPDNRHVAAAGAFAGPLVKANIPIWDAQNPDAAPVRLGTGVDSGLVDYSPGGGRVALSRSGYKVEVWSVSEQKAPLLVLPGSLGMFGADDNQLTSLRDDHTIQVWDLRNPRSPKIIMSGSAKIDHLAFSRNGRDIVTGSAGSPLVRLWDVLRPDSPQNVFNGPPEGVASVAVSADGLRVAAGGRDGSLRVWKAGQPGVPPMILAGNAAAVGSVVFSSAGDRLVAGSDDGNVRLWDLTRANAPPVVLSGHRGKVDGVAISQNGRWLASSGEDTTVRIWPLWSSVADYLCSRVWRNLSMDEWRVNIGEGIAYERTCPALPAGAGTPRPFKTLQRW
jgi:WD40 repeat protein